MSRTRLMDAVREREGASRTCEREIEEGRAVRHDSGGLFGPSRRPDRRGRTLLTHSFSPTTDLCFFFEIGDKGGDDTKALARLCARDAEMEGGSCSD